MCNPLNDDAALLTLLGDLLQTIKDGEEGFATAAKDVDSKDLRQLFTKLSLERASIRVKQEGIVKSLGEPQPDAEGSVLGAAHRGWIELGAEVASQNEEAILDECGRGEDSAVAAFTKALEQELPASVRVVLADHAGRSRRHELWCMSCTRKPKEPRISRLVGNEDVLITATIHCMGIYAVTLDWLIEVMMFFDACNSSLER